MGVREDEFMAKSVIDGDCWRWIGAERGDGYGGFRGQYAHRWSYERWVAPIPAGWTVDHFLSPGACIGARCVNPLHLRAATQRENILRSSGPSAMAAAATHCPQGHPYDGDNLYVAPKGDRRCRECNRQNARRMHAKRRAA